MLNVAQHLLNWDLVSPFSHLGLALTLSRPRTKRVRCRCQEATILCFQKHSEASPGYVTSKALLNAGADSKIFGRGEMASGPDLREDFCWETSLGAGFLKIIVFYDFDVSLVFHIPCEDQC